MGMSTTTLTPEAMADNILAVFDTVDLADASVGVEWYAEAFAICHALAAESGYTPEQVAGVIAATSPLNEWGQNVRLAERIIRAGGLSEGYLSLGLRKCDAILAGADIEVTLNGQKTVNFYRSIVSGGADGVCIDRHAHDIAAGRRFGDDERPSIGKRLYEAMASAYVIAAERLQAQGLTISPAEVQSVTWEAWRAEWKGVRA